MTIDGEVSEELAQEYIASSGFYEMAPNSVPENE